MNSRTLAAALVSLPDIRHRQRTASNMDDYHDKWIDQAITIVEADAPLMATALEEAREILQALVEAEDIGADKNEAVLAARIAIGAASA